jgi:hypothetical protein
MSGFSTSREREDRGAGISSSGTTLADGLGALLRRHAAVALTTAELRAHLRPLVRRARDMEATVEQVVVMAKRAWGELPDVRGAQADRADAARRLERVVTTIIELYFER